ncbi:lipocalin family protein [Flavobacterium hauense]
MKKAFALLTLAALTLLSCGDDDTQSTDSNDIIVGTWRYVGYIEPDGEYFPDNEETECYDERITFNKNRTGVALLIDCEEGNETNNFKWKKEAAESIYTVTNENGTEPESLVVKFEENKMKIFYDEVEADVYERVANPED